MLEIGQQFAHFKIVEKIGEGGMGAVFLAVDQKLNRQVALKLLLPDAFDNSEKKERFSREAKTAAQISHGNVMAIYDIGTTKDEKTGNDIDFIVMEHIKGKQLTDYFQTEKLDLNQTVRLAEKIAAGLAAAHNLNIVHRDIKADNIIINLENEPKILDFGLAKPIESVFQSDGDENTDTVDNDLTKAGKIIGTVSYMSPEQAKGEKVDTRSDIFSFGILLYRMACGEFPFNAPTQVSTLAKILESKHEPPRVKNAGIPPELERIIDKCLQKNPEDRYQDTRDLVVDLRNLRRQFDSGITSTISTEIDKPQITKTVNIKAKPALIVSIIAILVFIVVWQMYDPQSSSTSTVQANENSLAILGFDNKTNDESYDWLETGLPEILLTDLSQSQAIQIVSQNRILDCLPPDKKINHTFEECVDAARTLGAIHVLSGAFYKLGEQIRIDARIEEVGTGKIVTTHKVIGDDPFSLVDSLTKKISASLNLNDAQNVDKSVMTFVSSPEAYKQYLKGMDLFAQGFDNEAKAEFEKAIQIDSSFALPYMRIGMLSMFLGQQKIGAQYFSLAKQHEEKLPLREKALLDVYSELWLNQNFNNAYVKMESFVNQFPDDKEGQTILGVLQYEFNRDTLGALAHINKALEIDPTFHLALYQMVGIQKSMEDYDKALEYALKAKEHYPDSPDAYTVLAALYRDKGDIDRAIFEFQAMLQKFPNQSSPYSNLADLYIKKRDFKKSAQYNELIKEKFGDDPYYLDDYYYRLANLDVWEGKLKASLKEREKALEVRMETGDTSLVLSAYNSLGRNNYLFDFKDTAFYYLEQGNKWNNSFQNFEYYFLALSIDLSLAKKLKPVFDENMTLFRSKIPSSLWYIADNLEEMFDSFVAADTARLIDALIAANSRQNNPNENRGIGMYQILIGRYQDGIESINKSELATDKTSNAYMYVSSHYYLGIAEEGLGNTAKAIDHYEIVLNYWGEADLETELILDTKKRYKSLTS